MPATITIPDFFSDPAVHNDDQAYYAIARATCPVMREPHHGVMMVTGYDEAMEVLSKQSAHFSSAVAVTGPLPPLPFEPRGEDISDQLRAHKADMPWTDHLVTADGAEHQALRTILGHLLTHTRLKANEAYMHDLVDRLITGIVERGHCEITREYAHAVSTYVVSDLLGVPEEDRAELVRLLGLPPTQLGGDSAEKALTDPLTFLHERFAGYIDERRRNPRDDFMSELAVARFRDGSIPDPAIPVRLACFMFGAGQDTSARLMAFSLRVLGENPDLQARLRANPDQIPAFIEEVLRMNNPTKTLSRVAVTPSDIGGTPIAPGTVVTVCIGGVNRDPDRFANPDTFDMDRPNVRDHVTFSRGAHACIGAPLARMEGRVTLERFLARTSAIRISEREHGPAAARRYDYEPTYLLSGLKALHVEFDKA